jgi:hypothetical protein
MVARWGSLGACLHCVEFGNVARPAHVRSILLVHWREGADGAIEDEQADEKEEREVRRISSQLAVLEYAVLSRAAQRLGWGEHPKQRWRFLTEFETSMESC